MCGDNDSCKCLDDICCSLRDKSIFLACWTLAHAVFLFWCVVNIGMGFDDEVMDIWSLVLVILMLAVHLTGAICLFVGIFQENAMVFLLGIIFSSIYPYVIFFMVYIMVVQIIFTITSCKYYKILKGN